MLTVALSLALLLLVRSIASSLDPSLVRAKVLIATVLAMWLMVRLAT